MYYYLSSFMVSKEYTRNMRLEVGGDLIKLDLVWISILLPLTARSLEKELPVGLHHKKVSNKIFKIAEDL